MKFQLALILTFFSFSAMAEIAWNGDIRFRHEMNSRESGAPSSFHQQKIQGRISAKAKATEEADVEVRLATGTGRTSTNQVMGANKDFQNYGIGLDRAYFDYHGSAENFFHFYGGRIKNTYTLVGGNDLLFDSDLNFDGLAFATDYEVAPGVRVVFNQGFYWYSAGTIQDAHLLSTQLGLRGKWDAFNMAVVGTFYNFDHMAGQTTTAAAGNPTSGGVHTADYRVMDGGIELGYDFGEMPLTFYGEYAKNSATTTQNKAYIAGIKFGKFKDAGTWVVLYDYRILEQTAFVGALTDGDCAAGGADIKCHRFRGGYQWSKGLMTGMSYYLGKTSVQSTGGLKYNRLQIDATFYF